MSKKKKKLVLSMCLKMFLHATSYKFGSVVVPIFYCFFVTRTISKIYIYKNFDDGFEKYFGLNT